MSRSLAIAALLGLLACTAVLGAESASAKPNDEELLASKERVAAMHSPAFPDTAELLLEHLGEPYGAWDHEPTPAGCN